jgi:hypothetical protein
MVRVIGGVHPVDHFLHKEAAVICQVEVSHMSRLLCVSYDRGKVRDWTNVRFKLVDQVGKDGRAAADYGTMGFECDVSALYVEAHVLSRCYESKTLLK